MDGYREKTTNTLFLLQYYGDFIETENNPF